MLLRGEQLSAHLERALATVYLVYGDEPLLVIEAADAIRAAARRHGFDEREVLTADSRFNWHELQHAAGNLSLFGGRKLIDLRIPGGKAGREGGAALQAYCAQPLRDTLLLVTANAVDWREEKSAWFATLSTAGVVIRLITPPLPDLTRWISARLQRQQQSADAEGLHFIAERIEGNLLAAHQEIVKLAMLYPPGALTVGQIRSSVLNVARYDLDALREAMLAGEVTRLARILDGLRQEGEPPPLVLWAMSEEVRALAMVTAGLARQKSLDTLLREVRVRGNRLMFFKQALRRLDNERTTTALSATARIDRIIKGLVKGEVWDEFLRLGLSIASA